MCAQYNYVLCKLGNFLLHAQTIQKKKKPGMTFEVAHGEGDQNF